MMKRVKKLICVFLCISFMAGMLSVSACTINNEESAGVDQQSMAKAQELLAEVDALPEGASESEILDRVAADINLLKPTMLTEMIQVEEVGEESIVYSISYDSIGVKDIIHVEQMEDGTVAVTITEDDKQDVLVYQNGKFFLNGNRMEGGELPDDTYTPNAGANMVYSMAKAPLNYFNQTPEDIKDLLSSKVSGSYKYQSKNLVASKITLGKMIKNMTVSAIMGTLSSYAASTLLKMGANVGSAVLGSALSAGVSLAEDLIAKNIIGCGDSEFLSYKVAKYYNKNNDTVERKFIYAIDSYPKEDFYGTGTVWGVIESGYTT